jgi:hypothetical protein
VTGYINLQDYEVRNNTKNIHDYLKHCLPLLKSGFPFIIYCDEKYKSIFDNIIEQCDNDYKLLKLVTFKVEELKHNRKEFFETELPNNRNLDKDTHWYMLAICQKLYFMKEVTNNNPYNSKYFCWIDFGINHIMNFGSGHFNRLLVDINNCNIEDRIILASSGIPSDYKDIDKYINKFHECFMGGVIAGSKESIEWFADNQYKEIENMIINDKKITWEIGIWLKIFIENPHKFGLYRGVFNYLILSNFINYIRI